MQAVSIDDSATTEIDDALSVQGLGSGRGDLRHPHRRPRTWPSQPGSPLDGVARNRYSTVYMPGYKLTMLPDDVVQSYTLAEGRDCPAVSLYVTLDETTLTVKRSETRLERVPIKANLRHDQLDAVVTEASLTGEALGRLPVGGGTGFCIPPRAPPEGAARGGARQAGELQPARLQLPPRRQWRGQGRRTQEATRQVRITERRRGAPLDLIVAEAMILANSTWGGWLHELGVPGIYRSQASLAPGIKVRMGTKALPHAGMGVAQYTWATSPLRRYVDLVNQWQIIACARHGRTAALVAPFKPKDAELFSVISGFDAAYSAYNQFQNGLERYWTLSYLQQQGLTELDGAVMKDALVRTDALPLVVRALGAESLCRAARGCASASPAPIC